MLTHAPRVGRAPSVPFGSCLRPLLHKSRMHRPCSGPQPVRWLLGHTPELHCYRVLGQRHGNAHPLQQTSRCQAAPAAVEEKPIIQEDSFKTAAKEMPAPRGGKLKEKATAYIEEHRIRAYEADPNQRSTMVTMSNLLQVPRPPFALLPSPCRRIGLLPSYRNFSILGHAMKQTSHAEEASHSHSKCRRSPGIML